MGRNPNWWRKQHVNQASFFTTPSQVANSWFILWFLEVSCIADFKILLRRLKFRELKLLVYWSYDIMDTYGFPLCFSKNGDRMLWNVWIVFRKLWSFRGHAFEKKCVVLYQGLRLSTVTFPSINQPWIKIIKDASFWTFESLEWGPINSYGIGLMSLSPILWK